MSVGFIDTETRSRTSIRQGTDKYCRDAECTIVTWCIDDGPVRIYDKFVDLEVPSDLLSVLHSDIPLIAHSADFDRNIITRALSIETDVSRWRCTRAQAYSAGLPGSLELLGVVLGLPPEQQKMAEDGKRLIELFCEPDASGSFVSPYDRWDDWETFRDYAIRDTDALRAIYKKLPAANYQGVNLDWYHLDQLINERGFAFNAPFARAAVHFLERAKAVTDSALTDATDGAVTAATQRARLLNYLQEKLKLDIPNMKAAEIRAMLECDDLSPEARFLLETRLEAGKSSGSKYRRGLQLLGPQDRIRHTIQCNGAGRTGRSSGKGFQPHNMARPVMNVRTPDGKMELLPIAASYIDEIIMPGILSGDALNCPMVYGGPNEAASIALRHVIQAATGNELVVGDWSNIESRILAWLAGEGWKLEAYRAVDRGEGVDLYKLLFSQFFGGRAEEVNETERQSGKVSELAFGFGGGVGALVTMAAGYQMDLSPLPELVLPRAPQAMRDKAYKAWRRAFLTNEDYLLEPDVYQACDVLKQTYRASNTAINTMRHAIDDATKDAIRQVGATFRVGRCRIWSTGTWLIIELPSGRRLLYANPRIETEVERDPETGKEHRREYISYATARHQSWRRERAWSGLFVENIVQAVAADVLRWAAVRIHRRANEVPAVAEYLETLPTYERTALAFHVHDEVVLDVPKGSISLQFLLAWMIEPFRWSEGLPLAAAGWVGPIYGKR